VLAGTYKDVEGCETPVRTRKDKGNGLERARFFEASNGSYQD